MAVNRAVPLMYPKLKSRVREHASPTSNRRRVTCWWSSPSTSCRWRPARMRRSRITATSGSRSRKPALERAFRDTYGIEMKDVFFNEDLAICHVPSRRRDDDSGDDEGRLEQRSAIEIAKVDARDRSGDVRLQPVAAKTVRQGVRQRLREAARVRPIPRPRPQPGTKIGPFRSLSFSVPTPEAERLFLGELRHRRGALPPSHWTSCEPAGCSLPNTDFDTGPADGAGVRCLARRHDLRRTAGPACRPSSSPALPAALSAKHHRSLRRPLVPLPGATPDQQKAIDTKSRSPSGLAQGDEASPSATDALAEQRWPVAQRFTARIMNPPSLRGEAAIESFHSRARRRPSRSVGGSRAAAADCRVRAPDRHGSDTATAIRCVLCRNRSHNPPSPKLSVCAARRRLFLHAPSWTLWHAIVRR